MKISLISYSKLRYIQIENDNHSIEVSIDLHSLPKQYGRYEVINDLFIGVFSYNDRNYIYIDNNSIEINSAFSIDFFCAEKANPSWFKIYKEQLLVFEIKYINEIQTPYIDSTGMEDWAIHNFGSYIANCINKVKNNSSVILFQ